MSEEYSSLIDVATKYTSVSLTMHKLKQIRIVNHLPISNESRKVLREAIR